MSFLYMFLHCSRLLWSGYNRSGYKYRYEVKWIWEFGDTKYVIDGLDEVYVFVLILSTSSFSNVLMYADFKIINTRLSFEFSVWIILQFQLSKQKDQSHSPQWWLT